MSLAILEKETVRDMLCTVTVNQYHRMLESGLAPEKSELIRGIIFKKMTKTPLHRYTVQKIHDLFLKHIGADRMVSKEDPLTFINSEPEPDIFVVQGSNEDFLEKHPTTAELVIEVAVTSLDLDREKAEIYAEAGIPEYWIVIPEKRTVEVYTEPKDGKYSAMQVLGEKDEIKTIGGVRIKMKDVFG